MLILSAPCVVSVALDQGQKAKCDGILISAERAKSAVACKRELEIRRDFKCEPCPSCPDCKQPPMAKIASASFLSGFVLGLLLFLVR